MKDLLKNSLDRAQNDNSLVGIYLKENKSNEFIVGLVQGYVKNILTFISISRDVEPQNVVIMKVSAIVKIETNTKYLNNLKTLLDNKMLRRSLTDLKGITRKSNFRKILDQIIQKKEIITIVLGRDKLNSESGYLISFDDKYFQLKKVDSYGENNGFLLGRINHINEIRYGYKEQVYLKYLNTKK